MTGVLSNGSRLLGIKKNAMGSFIEMGILTDFSHFHNIKYGEFGIFDHKLEFLFIMFHFRVSTVPIKCDFDVVS